MVVAVLLAFVEMATNAKMLMNARKVLLVNAMAAPVRTPGVDLSAGAKKHDMCIERHTSKFAWFLILLVLGAAVGAGIAGYIFYKYRFRSYMDSEIMAIMSQYMPLDNHQNQAVHHEAKPLQHGLTV